LHYSAPYNGKHKYIDITPYEHEQQKSFKNIYSLFMGQKKH